jgi:hypothetical protein
VTDPKEIVDLLNNALLTDPVAIRALFSYKVPCNETMADHPSIVCSDLSETDDRAALGVLGLLNGLFPPRPDNQVVAAQYADYTGLLVGFCVVTQRLSKS